MNVAVYALHRFIDGIIGFWDHWYVRSFYNFVEYTLNLFEELDRSLAIKVNLRNLFKPLYQERNIIGYVLGFFLRGFKIIFGSIIYLVIFTITISVYLIWSLIPIFFIYKIVSSYGK